MLTEPATAKQLLTLRRSGYKDTMNLTRGEAGSLIAEYNPPSDRQIEVLQSLGAGHIPSSAGNAGKLIQRLLVRPSDAQLLTLKRLGWTGRARDITRKEASDLIAQLIQQRQERSAVMAKRAGEIKERMKQLYLNQEAIAAATA